MFSIECINYYFAKDTYVNLQNDCLLRVSSIYIGVVKQIMYSINLHRLSPRLICSVATYSIVPFATGFSAHVNCNRSVCTLFVVAMNQITLDVNHHELAKYKIQHIIL